MSNAEELKKYKELMDAGIITQEDFEKKKREVLFSSTQQESSPNNAENHKKKIQINPINKSTKKKIRIGVLIIAVLAIAFFGGKNVVEYNQQSKRAAALEAEIASIMERYSLSPYEVKYVDGAYEIFAEGFESLHSWEALWCLEDLDEVSVDDPCGDGEIVFDAYDGARVHPGLDVAYSYWRVSSNDVLHNQIFGGGILTQPGLYCNRYGNICIYEREN